MEGNRKQPQVISLSFSSLQFNGALNDAMQNTTKKEALIYSCTFMKHTYAWQTFELNKNKLYTLYLDIVNNFFVLLFLWITKQNNLILICLQKFHYSIIYS